MEGAAQVRPEQNSVGGVGDGEGSAGAKHAPEKHTAGGTQLLALHAGGCVSTQRPKESQRPFGQRKLLHVSGLQTPLLHVPWQFADVQEGGGGGATHWLRSQRAGARHVAGEQDGGATHIPLRSQNAGERHVDSQDGGGGATHWLFKQRAGARHV